MAVLSVAMFIVPAVFSLVIHDYLRHGEVSSKRKVILFFIYFTLINLITFGASYVRGVKGFVFDEMTLSYRLKYMGLGAVLGFVMPFIVCLLTEDIITIGGFIRYAKRLIKDLSVKYRVKYNLNIELITIRHYTDDIVSKVVAKKDVLVEQRSRATVQLVTM